MQDDDREQYAALESRRKLLEELPIAILPFKPKGDEPLTEAFLEQQLPWFRQLKEASQEKKEELADKVTKLYSIECNRGLHKELAKRRLLIAALAFAGLDLNLKKFCVLRFKVLYSEDVPLAEFLLQRSSQPWNLINFISREVKEREISPKKGYMFMQMLLQHGDDPNEYDRGIKSNRTALMHVLRKSKTNGWFRGKWAKEVVSLLLEHGARVDLYDQPDDQYYSSRGKKPVPKNVINYAKARPDCFEIVQMLTRKHSEQEIEKCQKFFEDQSK